MENKTVVRAVDVGYGNVKFTLSHPNFTSPIECSSFPSRSPVASGKSLAGGILSNLKTVTVQVGESVYEVGSDVAHAETINDTGAVLEKKFCLSDQYKARLLGALHYMITGKDSSGQPYMQGSTIDILVLGLPVATYRDAVIREQLSNSLANTTHKYPNGNTVKIGVVRVVPQPLGAFYDYANKNNLIEQLMTETNLIVDIGYFTFDWLFCHGMKPVANRSDSVNKGMSEILKGVSAAVIKQYGFDSDVNTLARILDLHLTSGKTTPCNVYSRNIDVMDYLGHGKPTINSALASLSGSVGDGIDINNIILAGGGAKFFQSAIEEKFPHNKVIVSDLPAFTNVRGFQLAGEAWASSAVVKARKEERIGVVS